jgi:hypothetical protein
MRKRFDADALKDPSAHPGLRSPGAAPGGLRRYGVMSFRSAS